MAADRTGRLRGMQDGGSEEKRYSVNERWSVMDAGAGVNARAWTFKRMLERGWTLEGENERGKS